MPRKSTCQPERQQPTTLAYNSTTTATLPTQPRKREHDATHLDQKHHAEVACALALAVSLLQKHLDTMKNHMPARTTATNNLPPWYHAHIQLNNHSDPNQPCKREHDTTHQDQRHHAEATLCTRPGRQPAAKASRCHEKAHASQNDSNLPRSHITQQPQQPYPPNHASESMTPLT